MRLGLLWLVLGGWIGAMLFFAAAVAPAAFEVLDTPEQAGRLVSRTLSILNLGGAAAGLALALLARGLGRGPWLWAVPLLLTVLCLGSHFGVSAALAEIRAQPGWDSDPAVRARFGALHGASVGLLGLTLIGAIGLLAAHARAWGRPAGARKSSENS